MTEQGLEARFNEGYLDADLYEATLPPHIYGGVEDTSLVGNLLAKLFGPPAQQIDRILDIGCGPGRVSSVLAPYAKSLVGADKSAGMTSAFSKRFPDATTINMDTESLVNEFLREGRTSSFGVIGSFWSLSYPLLECFEETNSSGVQLVGDESTGRVRANSIVDGLVQLLDDGGLLIGLFFDAETAEQRFVTDVWERVFPFPGNGRGFTWELLRSRLAHHERSGTGRLVEFRFPGVARLKNQEQARDWFEIEHFNSHKAIIGDPTTRGRIDEFVARYTREDGGVELPSGVHVFLFERLSRSGIFTTDRVIANA